MNVITYLKDAIEKRAAYLHTKAEIENMPLDMALDLDIYRPEIRSGHFAFQGINRPTIPARSS
jgi:hypothetical protein